MENKQAQLAPQNIQDTFLNNARRDRSHVTLYLVSGVKLTGRIRSFDKYSVVLETNNQEQLIFKHAISTLAIHKTHSPEKSDARPDARPEVKPETRPEAATPAAMGDSALDQSEPGKTNPA